MSDEIIIDLFTRLRQRWKALASRILHDEEEAEDALHDAFCKLWAQRADIHTTAQGEALTATTLRHLSIDRWRRQHAHPTLSLDQADSPLFTEEDEEEERRRHYEQLQRWVDERLTPLQRHILYAHEYDGDTLAEIATALSMQPAAVRMQLSRARKTIRSLYHELQQRNR